MCDYDARGGIFPVEQRAAQPVPHLSTLPHMEHALPFPSPTLCTQITCISAALHGGMGRMTMTMMMSYLSLV